MLQPPPPAPARAPLREIVLDTETSGISPTVGAGIVEIACVELAGGRTTGREFHAYVDPGHRIHPAATAVHGLTNRDLLRLGARPFAAVAADLLAFLGGAAIVAHNAAFDMRFLNAELQRLGRPPLGNTVVCTLKLARPRHGKARLADLCAAYGVETAGLTLHSAITDARLLARVYALLER
jgi:DNA polymerase-3 subunit epsilon